MKKKLRFSLVTLLTLVMLVSTGTTAFAAEAQPKQPAVAENTTAAVDVAVPEANSDEEGIMPLAASGYAAHYTDTFQGSFYINVTGSSSLLGTAKIKAWDFGNSNVDIYATLYRPDGSVAVSSVKLPVGTEISKTFTNLPTGTYRLAYVVYSDKYKGWIYCNIS